MYLHDFLGAITEVLLDLLVAELEHLQSIDKCGLGCLCLCKVVNHLLIREGLLDVVVVEVHDGVAVRVRLSFDSVAEDYFFLAV